jgi:hypothetical protein
MRLSSTAVGGKHRSIGTHLRWYEFFPALIRPPGIDRNGDSASKEGNDYATIPRLVHDGPSMA